MNSFIFLPENVNTKSPFLVEGDIRIKPGARASIKHNLWPNGVVPYEFSPYFGKKFYVGSF